MHPSLKRAAPFQNRVKTSRRAGTLDTELLFQANSMEIGKPLPATPAKLSALANIVNSMLADGPESEPDRTGNGHKMRPCNACGKERRRLNEAMVKMKYVCDPRCRGGSLWKPSERKPIRPGDAPRRDARIRVGSREK